MKRYIVWHLVVLASTANYSMNTQKKWENKSVRVPSQVFYSLDSAKVEYQAEVRIANMEGAPVKSVWIETLKDSTKP